MKYFNPVLSAALSLVLLVAAGCQSTGAGSASVGRPMYRAVVSRPSNGQPLVFLIPTESAGRGGKVQAMAAAGKPVCEGCRAEAQRYYRSGQMATNCAICNAGLTAVEPQP
ncbi:MAG: hypothetical protein AVDCRST_MAG64-3085 [uncultured Phycisphaerae bacterium]|uniref:Uncharacterized protein n=1 Tax=uncultured Phycisphaerae bacterium TaxID=904963 RepID=A0A6J4PXC2_9BACT|nr:MAG: hypothetical protein AVDCRST_MAG64-3085 [uncultured Phycisphaerae bacterium]